MPLNWVYQAAQALALRYKTRDPFEICAAQGITIFSADLPETIRGFYSCAGGVRMICINQRLSPAQRKAVCAHELGHCVLHEGVNAFFLNFTRAAPKAKFEHEADFFCACLLVDEDECALLRADGVLTVGQLAASLELPEEFVRLRFAQELR